ncbi:MULTISPECIES: UDP-N-acetylmuramate dehydrogenase [unclassified Microbacterium]|uniref:UDP-N-acetylmuramate dehydrogenase n=1 Tax=unclassified Microbacterium TaxID=2609290 RepID=UPI00097F415C|nr:UDP-N-acetylmuramate dehydrogenase [Microbacterium sp. JB110]RCS61300.1 UDP-N-acetylmuramate dehydrogenase [Microbacterium sp. JB110]SJM51026.1 UDP-N-acetylenolpyruvoylglucosamine reductase [Frigoribacterium sp. JB110]
MSDPLPLSQLTTLQVGAAPERMIDAHTREGITDALHQVWADGDDWFVLGGGSNLLVGDEPFDGTVIRILTHGFQAVPGAEAGRRRIRIEAGQNWDEFVAWTVGQGLAGVEAMSGIPGTAGAAPIQNVGAYGQEIDQTLVEVELIDEATGETHVVPAGDLGLGPRTSDLKRHYGSEPRRRAVILSITLELDDVGTGAFSIRDQRIAKAIGADVGAEVTLAGVRESVLAIRASKGMVLDPADDDTRSAGSFFNNPILSESEARALPEACPRWPLVPDIEPVRVIPLESFDGYVPPAPVETAGVKVSAAWLIENAGLSKGFRLGRARASLSTKHTLALTNRGGATAWEVTQLARFVQTRVSSEFGIELQPEPVFVGVEL